MGFFLNSAGRRVKKTLKETRLEVGDLVATVQRKNIKNLYLRVCRPENEIRVSAPLRALDREISAFILSRLDWIEKQRLRLAGMERPEELRFADGEMHCFLGRKMRLRIVERPGKARAFLNGDGFIYLGVPSGSKPETRRRALEELYRETMAEELRALLACWPERLGVTLAGWRIRKMKSRWGSCQPKKRRICLSLELAKRKPACLEYVLIHELAHLLEPGHNDRFRAILDRVLPGWRELRGELRRPPG